jgi:hypothetical protein
MYLHLIKRGNCDVMDMLTGLIVVVISQCICIAKQCLVYLKYVKFPFVNYISIKVGKITHFHVFSDVYLCVLV